MLKHFYHIHSFIEHLGLSKKDCYVFGGTVRDRLLGRNLADIDLAVAGKHSFECLLDKVSRSAKVVLIKREFSFVKLVLNNKNSTVVDLQLADEIKDFLYSRDFTINSLAVRLDHILRFMSVPEKGFLIDLNGGFSDLNRGILRTCSDTSFEEDPIRILRAAYYASKINLQFHKSLVEQARKSLDYLKTLKKEKLRENFLNLAFDRPFKFFHLLNLLGASEALFGRDVSPEKLKRIKHLSERLCSRNLSRAERSLLKAAILAEAGAAGTPLFAGAFSRKTLRKAMGISGKILLESDGTVGNK